MNPDDFKKSPPDPWEPWKPGLFWILSRCVYQDFLGAGYKYYRKHDLFVKRFLTRRAAQAYANKLNQGDLK